MLSHSYKPTCRISWSCSGKGPGSKSLWATSSLQNKDMCWRFADVSKPKLLKIAADCQHIRIGQRKLDQTWAKHGAAHSITTTTDAKPHDPNTSTPCDHRTDLGCLIWWLLAAQGALTMTCTCSWKLEYHITSKNVTNAKCEWDQPYWLIATNG